MAAKPLPDQTLLNQLLRYEPETGKLFWLRRDVSLFEPKGRPREVAARIWNTRYAGEEALTHRRHGYFTGAIHGVEYMAHRVIWRIMTGDDPEGEIDHINGVRDDNRWCNLRLVSSTENRRNSCVRSDNQSGTVGVSRYARTGKWWAYIVINGTTKHLGLYDDKQEAIRARKKAERVFGFHPNHGRKRAG